MIVKKLTDKEKQQLLVIRALLLMLRQGELEPVDVFGRTIYRVKREHEPR